MYSLLKVIKVYIVSRSMAFLGFFPNLMGDYRYHELRPLISYFPCHWVVPVDFPNTCPMKIVRIFYQIIARYARDFYTLTQYFPNQQWCNKSTYDLVERFLFPLSFYRRYIKIPPKKIPYSQGKPRKLDLPSLPLQPFKTYSRRRGNS